MTPEQIEEGNDPAPIENHFYLATDVGVVHVNMIPNADQETIDALKKMIEMAYNSK